MSVPSPRVTVTEAGAAGGAGGTNGAEFVQSPLTPAVTACTATMADAAARASSVTTAITSSLGVRKRPVNSASYERSIQSAVFPARPGRNGRMIQ